MCASLKRAINRDAGTSPNSLIESAERLLQRLNDPSILVVDCRSYSEYLQFHIPGAVNLDLMQFHWIDTSPSGIRAFNVQSRQLLSNIGVSKGTRVVFYDNISGSAAPRGVWLLLYFSHKDVAMLDGGLNRWKNLGYPLERRTNPFRHSQFKGRPDRSLLASIRDVHRIIKDKSAVVIDARSPSEYSGKIVRAARAGHVPGALNIDWTRNLTRGSFKRLTDLRRLYSEIPRNSRIVTYCQGGYRAANSFVALYEIGFRDVSMYLGSWGEWGNNLNMPASRTD